jgi:hypothetical protein
MIEKKSEKVPSEEEIKEVFGGKILKKPIPKEIPKKKPAEENITWDEKEIKSVSETAKQKLAKALNKKVDSTISITKEGDVWSAIIEVVDEEYLPGMNLRSMSDIMGIYEAKLSSEGELVGWTKKSSRKRGQT